MRVIGGNSQKYQKPTANEKVRKLQEKKVLGGKKWITQKKCFSHFPLSLSFSTFLATPLGVYILVNMTKWRTSFWFNGYKKGITPEIRVSDEILTVQKSSIILILCLSRNILYILYRHTTLYAILNSSCAASGNRIYKPEGNDMDNNRVFLCLS